MRARLKEQKIVEKIAFGLEKKTLLIYKVDGAKRRSMLLVLKYTEKKTSEFQIRVNI